jgi:hypothetical protein
VELTAESTNGLGDASALREAVLEALRRAAGGCLPPGTYRLKLTADAAGKVTRVEVLSSPGDAARRCVETTLLGLEGRSRPESGTDGSWTATIRVFS